MSRRPMHSLSGSVAVGALVVAMAVGAAAKLGVTRAHPHDAPPSAMAQDGWTYPYACCSDKDCREVAGAAVRERPEGYVIQATGEVISYQDRRVRHSPDGLFHICTVAGLETSRTICLFVPPRAF
ncbi:hypothetical protein [Nitratireductor luteus]|uniref:hypothetical protein n=1 Tax=Nitratireductor luteus TaxID=2976980 RepID=UPI00223FD164|nr:hypothetical protein [Nitratireductor luteus]